MVCLLNESISYSAGGFLMTDAAIIAATTKITLQEISKQASALGNGLLNAAPADKSGVPNNSVQYLLAVAEALNKIALQCDLLYKHKDELTNKD